MPRTKHAQPGAPSGRIKPHYRLSDLLDGITPETVHLETYWGPVVGKEFGCRAPANPAEHVNAKLQALPGDEG